jgi:hypothetical protein
MYKRHFWFLLLISFFLSPTLIAQSDSARYEGLKYRKWRVTLFPPISSNSAQAPNYTAKYSINLIGGVHGGLNGREIGLLFNINQKYAKGFQLVGGINYSGGDMEGMNIAGITNIAADDMSGMQIAGAFNVSQDDLEGMQIAGLMNYAKGYGSGLQVAGLGNYSQSDLEGLQAAGLFNASKSDISGLQVAGLMNIARGSVEGLQASILLNYSGDDISGMQAVAGANISRGNIEGMVAAGGFNYARGDVSGLVASGGFNLARNIEGLAAAGIANISNNMQGLQAAAVNYSQTATGLQVGIINIAKDFEGAPVGALSLYGNGRKNIDLRFSDAGFTDLAITTGTHRVYNMAMIGYNTLLNRNVYRVGIAVGLEKNIQDSFDNFESESMFANQEFSVHHIVEGEWNGNLNLLYSYKYLVGKRFGSGISIYGGPSLNAQVSRVNTSGDYTWYSVWSPTRKGRQYRFWAGMTVGVRVFKQKNLPLLEDDWGDINERWDW